MALTRIKKQSNLNYGIPSKLNVNTSVSSLSNFQPSPITAPHPYYFVSQLPDTTTMSTNVSIHTGGKIYVVMEGNKRIMTWGLSNGFPLNGMGNVSDEYMVYPVMAQYDIPLDSDDEIISLAVSHNCAGFTTSKGYLYVGGDDGADGWLGFGDTTNRFAFSRVAHADSTTTATFSSGGAVSASTMVITATNADIKVGQVVAGIGIPAWTTVAAVSGTTISFSNRFHTQASGLYSFGVPWGPGGVKAKKLYIQGGAYNSATDRWALVLSQDGNIYASGYNAHGQMGNGTTTSRSFYSRITSLSNIREVYISTYSAGAIDQNNRLFVWGHNAFGHLANGTITSILSPIQSAPVGASVVNNFYLKSYFNETAFCITNDGRAFAAGSNYTGSLGINVDATTTTNTWTAVNTTNIGSRRVIDIKAAGTTSNSSYTTYFLCDDGEVFAAGYNGYGNLGDGTTTNRAIPVRVVPPTDFPKVDKIYVCGGAAEIFLTAVNMASGRMFSVGSFNSGAIGQAIGEPTATWAMTAATSRAQYPAREVTSPPPVEDGYASIKDIWTTSVNNFEVPMFCLLNDGTLWVRGRSHYMPKGSNVNLNYLDGTHMYYGSYFHDVGWKQVEF